MLALVALVLGGCATTNRQVPADPALEKAADDGMAKSATPGLAIMEIRDGKPTAEIVRGVRALDKRDPVRPGDVWHIGSNSKPITATLIAMLVERRKLRWDSRLADLFPELAASMHPDYRDVTILDLATHRSGLASEVGKGLIEAHYVDRRNLRDQRKSFVATVTAQQPAQPRGTYAYSNRGYVVLGAVADRVGGKPVEQLLDELIFRRLGMKTGGFGPTHRGQPLGHEGGKPITGVLQDNPAVFTTAGTMKMSLADWSRWAIDQMAGERGRGRLMSAASYRFLHTGQMLPPGRKTAIAPGWGVRTENYGRILTHTGSNGKWFAVIALAPDLQNGILTATNSAEDMKGDVAGDPAFYLVTDRWKQHPMSRSTAK
jgi:CubicO group peptidase (beta-lactamase class C family)